MTATIDRLAAAEQRIADLLQMRVTGGELLLDGPVKDHGDGLFTWQLAETHPQESATGKRLGPVRRYVCGHMTDSGCYVTQSGQHVTPGLPNGKRPQFDPVSMVDVAGLPETGHWVKLHLPEHIEIKQVSHWGVLLVRRGDVVKAYCCG